jgi:hypothetical protein
MKNIFLPLCGLMLFAFFNCSTPEKKIFVEVDSDSTRSIYPPGSTKNAAISYDSLMVLASLPKSTFDKENPSTYFILDNYFPATDLTVDPADLQLIDSTCAVLIYPTDEQLTVLQKEYGDDYATVADDNSYYHGLAIEMLDSIDVETNNAEKRILQFKNDSQTWTLDVRKEGAPAWNLIFFNKEKGPMIVPYIDLSHDRIKEYFGAK